MSVVYTPSDFDHESLERLADGCAQTTPDEIQ
jgi:hypothetical protein